MIIMQNNLRKIWATVDLSMVIKKGDLCHYYSVLSVFSQIMGHPQPIKIVIIKKCLKLPRNYGIVEFLASPSSSSLVLGQEFLALYIF